MTATQVVVWVNASSWSSPSWQIVNRLIPETSDHSDGSMGRAVFRMLRSERNDGAGDIVDTFYPARGSYIAIARAGGSSPFDSLLWCGQIVGIHPQPIQHDADEMGDVEAVELGSVLAQTPVANLRQGTSSLLTEPLATNPTANLAGANGEIIGNMRAPASGIPWFEAFPENCGAAGVAARWNQLSLLRHVLTYAPAGTLVPPLSLSPGMPALLSLYLANAELEVVELDGLSIKDLIDLMVGTTRGMSWHIIPTSSGWTIWADSASDVGFGDFPAAYPLTATLNGNDADLALDTSGMDVYDAVEVLGAPIVCCGTMSPIDGSLGAGWVSLTAYKVGASAQGGYAVLTVEGKLARNRAVRRAPVLQDVLTRFQLMRYSPTTDLQCKSAAGVPTVGATQPLTPLVVWNGASTSVSPTQGSVLYLPTAKVLRNLPWPSGVSADGSDGRTDIAKGQPSYLLPVVLRYTTTGDAWVGWSDMLRPPSAKWPIPTVSVDDRGAAIRIEYDHPEVLAKGLWTGAAASEFNPDLTTSYGATDWQRLVVTVAVESGQRVKARVLRSGITEAQVRNVLRIERPDLHCWLMRAKTIIGLKGDGTPDEISADTFTRDDHAIAQQIADQAAAFAFRPRTSGTITVTDPANPPAWAAIGTLIDVAQEQRDGVDTVATTLGSVVRGVRQVWNPRAPRLIVTTDYQTAAVGNGQAVSVSLGGTVSASLQRTRMELGEVRRDVQRAPVSPGSPARPIQQGRSETITKSAHGWTVGTWVRNNDGGAWATADRTGVSDFENLALVIEVIDADRVVVALDGMHNVPAMTGLTPFRAYYLSTAGASVYPSPDTTVKTAPVVERMTHVALSDDWIWLPGPRVRNSHNHHVGDLADVVVAATPIDGHVLTYEAASALWKPTAAAGGLGTRAAISVIGRSANSAGAAADIAASTSGDVLYLGASSLTWGPLGTASYQPASVTAAKLGTDVVLDTLNDVTIASVASKNFLRYDTPSTQWKNYDLGPIEYATAVSGLPVLVFDGGGVTGSALIAALGKSGSRLLLDFVSGTTTTALDFVLSGAADLATEKVARIRTVSASQVSFYDQGTSSITAGDEVLRWGCSSLAASRYFRSFAPLQVTDTVSGTNWISLEGTASRTWELLARDAGSSPASFFKFYADHASLGDRIRCQTALDMNGFSLQFYGITSSLSESAGVVTLAGATGVRFDADKMGFFYSAGTLRVAVAAPAAITAIGGADATYSANEQTLLNALTTDVTNLRSTLNNLRNALNGYNLV
ncbi:hypothetical protein [Methylibium sp.]|uniref:hypothetical protein n=1 Tax=Methylibium sp. TaxID=2067992 RepID=UPI001812DC25|nr:hypothetical protein [Methylibium sp.]MBA3588854.1 hypothetical protein [Methylibium sp.]